MGLSTPTPNYKLSDIKRYDKIETYRVLWKEHLQFMNTEMIPPKTFKNCLISKRYRYVGRDRSTVKNMVFAISHVTGFKVNICRWWWRYCIDDVLYWRY